jgi:type I restriction enzyme S subunit
MKNIELEKIVYIKLGLTHTPTYVTKGIPFLSVKDISNGAINFDNCKYITKEEYDSLPQGAKPQIGDLLFCRVGTIGKPILVDERTPKFGSFVSLGYFRNKDERMLHLNYLKHWMNSENFMKQVQSNVKGASQINLNTGWLSKFTVPIGNLEDQKYKTRILDKTISIIHNKKQQLQEYDQLIKSRFVEMFGDPKTNSKRLPLVKPEEICESISAGGDRPNEVSSIRTEDFLYPIFSNGEKDDGLYGWSKGYRIGKPAVTISGRGTIGYTSFRKDGKFTPIVRLIVMIPNEKINPIYLTYYMNLEREIGSGSGVQQLTVPMIKEKSIILPDIVEQNNFALLVEQVDKLKFEVQKSLDETQKLFDSLMQEYFG